MKARSKKTILKNKITKEKKDMNKNKKAQVSIEMIIILSVLILGAVVLASLLLGFFNKSVDTNVDIDAQTGNTVNSFINDLVNYNDSNNEGTPNPTPLSYNLTLTPNNPSFGTAETSGSYQAGSLVTVTASPNVGYSFDNWTVTSTAVVASLSSSYSFNMPSNDLALTANFSLTPPTNCTLSLPRSPHFGGTTTGDGTYTCNSSVTATATPVINYQFVNWTTPTGTVTTNPYTFNLTSNQVFTANFSPSAYSLNLTKAGSGNGTVTSNPAGISCTSSCTSDSHTFNVNQPVTLTATAVSGHSFAGWSGDCTGTIPTCTVTMDAVKNVTATFNLPNTYLLSVSKENPLGGEVFSSGPTLGIICGATCSASYSNGTAVSLTATPAIGYTFVEWRGDCTGATCSLTMTSSKDVNAVFAPIYHNLNINKVSGSYGFVNSLNPNPGIICGSDCTEGYFYGTNVTLTASGLNGGTFAGWSGAGCSGTGTCTVTMDSPKLVTATFNPPVVNHILSVNKTGTGSGNVVASDVGIDCGGTCSYSYNQGTMVTLNAIADAGSSFSGWSGAGCSGTGTCMVTMDAAKSVTATFNPAVVFCPSSLEYNGSNYKLIQIGNQCWFAENLRTTKYSDGSNISTGLDSISWQKALSGAYEVYDHTNLYANGINSSAEMISAYGLLYNWYALKDVKGLCPNGYRVSTDYDFEVLKNYVNNFTSDNQPARYLKSDRTAIGTPTACTPTNNHPRFLYELSSGQCGLNTFGFSAIPAGYIKPDKSSDLLGVVSYFWIDGHFNDNYAHHYSTTYYRTDFTNWGLLEKSYGMSVRCVKDNLVSPVVLNYTLDVTRNNASLGSVTGQGTVQGGSNVTVNATPNSGANFLYWTDSQNEVVSTSQNYTFKMPYSNFYLIANFNSTVPPVTINLYNPTSNQQFPPYYTHPTDGTGIRLMASISGSSASNWEFYKRWQVSRDNLSWNSFFSTNTGNSVSAYALYVPSETGVYYFRLKYTDDNYPGSTFYSNVVQVNVVSLP